MDAVPFTVTFPSMVPPVSGRYRGAKEAVAANDELTASKT